MSSDRDWHSGLGICERLTGRRVAFAIRPELIEIRSADSAVPAGMLGTDGTLEDVLYHGASSRLRVKVDEHTTLAVARAETAGGGVAGLATGARVRLAWRPEHAVQLQG